MHKLRFCVVCIGTFLSLSTSNKCGSCRRIAFLLVPPAAIRAASKEASNMFRLSVVSTALIVTAFAAGTAAFGQGVLVDIRPDHPIRLPRPIIPWHPHPQPQPPSTYKIDSIEVNAKL